MDREILFRGKRLDNGEWYYGSYLFLHIPNYDWTGEARGPAKDVHFIIDEEDINIAVNPATVGQYIGLTDKNGVKIFEGDIISYSGSREVVRFDTSLRIPCFTMGIDCGSSTAPHPYKISMRHIVVGNIHDNPELLEVRNGAD